MRPRTRILLRRRLRNLALLLLTPPLALLALRTTWSLESSHRLAAIQSTLRAHHLPASPQDLTQPPIPDTENAALPLLHALQICKLTYNEETSDTVESLRSERAFFVHESDRPLLLHSLAENVDALHDLDTAAIRSSVAWPVPEEVPPFTLQAGGLTTILALRVLLATDDERIHAFQRLAVYAYLLDTCPSHYAHSDANDARAAALPLVEADPRLSFHDPVLIRALADDTVARRRTIASDASFASAPAIISSHFPWLENWFLSPLAHDEAARIESRELSDHAAFAAADCPAALALVPTAPSPYGRYLHLDWTTKFAHPNFSPLRVNDIYWDFDARTTAHALALLIAAADFNSARGHFPQSPNDLLPDFLLYIPSDPFSPSNAPLHYRLDPSGPTVWSVGQNGTDENGTITVSPTRSTRTGSPDMVFGAAFTDALKAAAPRRR